MSILDLHLQIKHTSFTMIPEKPPKQNSHVEKINKLADDLKKENWDGDINRLTRKEETLLWEAFLAESAPGLKFAIFPTRAAARAKKSKWAGLARAVARAETQISNFSIKI